MLWDAFEDCLCKTELRAEFDRLKAERNALDGSLKAAKQESDRYINIAYDNMIARDEAQAENKAIEKSRQAFIKILDETMLENEELQSWLDKICEPYSNLDYHWDLSMLQIMLKNSGYWYAARSLKAIAFYLDSQKPSQKPKNDLHFCDASRRWMDGDKADCTICSPKCEHKNGGISYYSEGVLRQWCDDCKEWFEVTRGLARSQKPPTLCPECGGTRQKRKEIWKESSLHNLEPDYVIYERCPRCKGEGVI